MFLLHGYSGTTHRPPASWDYNKYGRPSPAFFIHRYYLTPAQCETYEAGRHMVRTYDEGFNLVLKLISRV